MEKLRKSSINYIKTKRLFILSKWVIIIIYSLIYIINNNINYKIATELEFPMIQEDLYKMIKNIGVK